MSLVSVLMMACVGDPSSPGIDTGSPAPDTGKPDTGKPDTGTASTGDSAKGKVIYETYCIACHGPEGRGATGLAGSLRVSPSPVDQSDEVLVKVIREGVTGPNGQMPAWADVIDRQDATDTIAYLRLSFGSKTENR